MDTVIIEDIAKSGASTAPGQQAAPRYSQQVEDISQELMGYIADKWTLVVLEELGEKGVMRFSDLRKAIPKISQKMLTQTLRQMERNGLVSRTIHPVIPPRVEYRRTPLGQSLGPVICGLWTWVEANTEKLVESRSAFDQAAVTPAMRQAP